jgi:hypothetical protein
MLNLNTDSVEYNDDGVCLQSGIYRSNLSENSFKKRHIMLSRILQVKMLRLFLIAKLRSDLYVETILGQQIFQKQIAAGQNKYNIEVGTLSPAMYILRVQLANGEKMSEKLIISR